MLRRKVRSNPNNLSSINMQAGREGISSEPGRRQSRFAAYNSCRTAPYTKAGWLATARWHFPRCTHTVTTCTCILYCKKQSSKITPYVTTAWSLFYPQDTPSRKEPAARLTTTESMSLQEPSKISFRISFARLQIDGTRVEGRVQAKALLLDASSSCTFRCALD